MWKVQNKINNKGVTLIELLVALAIFSIATVFLAYTLTSTIRHNFRNSLRDMATTVLNNKMNEIKSMDYDDKRLDNDTTTVNSDDPFYSYVYKYGKNKDDNITYTIKYEIENIDIKSTNANNEGMNDNSLNNLMSFENKLKRIRITIKWKKPYSPLDDYDNVTAVFYKAKETH